MRLFSLLVLLVFLTTACESNLEEIKEVAAKKDALIETGTEVEIVYSSMGKTTAKLIAPTLVKHKTKDPNTEFPDGLKLFLYNDSLRIESKLTANYGIKYDRTNLMIVRNNVVFISTKGEKLTTEELIRDEEKEKIYTDQFVRISTPDEIIFGEGFESNLDFSNYKIKKIKGTVNVEPDQGTESK